MPRLVVEKGNDKGRVYSVEAGGVIVGRDSTASVQLRDTQASRQHFQIEQRGDGYVISDLGSMNGTLVNGRRIEGEHKLQFGDLIKVGETTFSFLSNDTTPEEALLGQRMGGYRILERIGRGGMGTVYKAEQIDLQRIVALKVISEEHAKVKDFIQRFVDEARAAAKLNHANIVQVYDVKKYNDLYYFSMEYVPGGSVQDLLNKQRRVPWAQAAQMILDAARGLEYAHKKEIIHRDVKPDNLMIAETGSIKIGDMGLAQRLGEKLAVDDGNSVIGTPHYIAPEQVVGRPADYRSDIYALGGTMYRMIAGFTAYQAPTVRELVNKKVREDPVPLHTAVEGVPLRISDICARMMARKPEERYQTMTEIMTDLECAQRELSVKRTNDPGTEGVEIGGQQRKLLIASLCLLVIVILGAGVGVAVFWKKEPPPPVLPPRGDATEQDAARALDVAKTFEIQRMDVNKPEDIQRAIKEFSSVIERFPETPAAKEAQQRVEELSRRLRETAAQITFVDLEKLDRENWRKMYQAFQAEGFDLAPIEATIAAYERFGESDEARGTSAGLEAVRRAGFVRDWKVDLVAMHSAFGKVRERAVRKRDEERFNEAWVLLDEFAQTALSKKPECWFAADRYTSYLFEESAREMQRRVVRAAETAYDKLEDRVRAQEQEGKFEEAIQMLGPVVEHYPDEIRLRAIAKRNSLGDVWARHRAEEAERVQRASEAALAADVEAFERCSREAHRDVLAGDFMAAHARFDVAPGPGKFPRTEEYRKRVATRSRELNLLVTMKETLVRMVNDVKNYPNLKRQSPFGGLSGRIIHLDDREFTIEPEVGGGTVQLPIRQLHPADFYAFMRNVSRWTDPKIVQGFVIYCCETGLYESAAEELKGLRSMNSKDKALEEFCDQYEALIEADEYSDSDEVEAEKRYQRVQQFMAEEALEEARREIDILKRRYKATQLMAEKREEIEEQLDALLRQGGDELKKKMRAEQGERIKGYRSQGRTEWNRNKAEILTRISRIQDPIQRDARFGEYFIADGDLQRSTDRLQAAKVAVDRAILSDRSIFKAYANIGAAIYARLYRNALLGKNRGAAASIRAEGNGRFGTDEMRGLTAWPELIDRVDKWEVRLREARDLESLERGVREHPDQPQRLWDLVEVLLLKYDYVEARGCLRAMMEVFPDASQVKSGEAQYQLAEVMLVFHEVETALSLYRDLRKRYPEHPRVREDKRGEDGVQRRIDLCYDLLNKMGIKPESGERK